MSCVELQVAMREVRSVTSSETNVLHVTAGSHA